MAASRTPREIILDIVRQQLALPELSFEQALEHPAGKLLFDALSPATATGSQAAAPSPEQALAQVAVLPSVIKAAISDTYLLDEIDADSHVGDALLVVSDLVMVGGSRRLRLQDVHRAAVIDANRGQEQYRSLLEAAVLQDSLRHEEIGKSVVELPSAWLRCFLSGAFRDLETAPPKELKAALGARERLRFVDGLPSGVPSVADLARQVSLAELLEPLRVLIGAQGGWDGTTRTDRFVGRDLELRRLRAFVDELSSQSFGEFIGRVSSYAVNTITGSESSGIMIVTARGGLGKSTLLAKFVLDHALDQRRPFPFAYLDFDRAGIDAERPRQLLMEIARQVGLQFPSAQPELSRLSDDIRTELMSQQVTTEFSNPLDITDPFARFAEILRGHSTFGERAFLLVLDTLEIVQWNSKAIDNLAELIDEFRRKGLRELRVVASGRADIPELRHARGTDVPSELIELKPLLVKEARQLANALGRSTLGETWQTAWGTAIAGTATDNDVRREPLAVRVATDLVARTEPAKRDDMVRQIAETGVGAADDFVARLYEKRIVNHVQDPRAKKLAWPGLVVRRLTSEIVRTVLAPLCDISPNDADAAFLALGQEIWMVYPEAGGTVLRHRPDLRARTLPLMRRLNKERFYQINRAAIEYFSEHRGRSLDDYGEWIYHRMLGNEPMSSIEGDVREDVLPTLAKAESDFPPESEAASYLAARSADARLSPKRIRELRPVDALRHLSVTSSGTFGLDDPALDRVALDVAGRLDPQAAGLGAGLGAWARALWIKVGAWQRIPIDAPLDDLTPPVIRMHVFWAARMTPTLSDAPAQSLLERCRAAVGRGEQAGLRSTVQTMAMARLAHSPAFIELDRIVASILGTTRPNPIASMQAALRLAIVLGDECRQPALDLWLASRRRGSSDRVRTATLSRRELDALVPLHPSAAQLFGNALGPSRPERFADDRTISGAATVIDDLAARPDTRDALSRLFALRQEDWIVPLAYAAAGAVRSVPAALTEQLRQYARGAEVPADMVGAFRFADEAGSLAECVGLIVKRSDDAGLRFLYDAFRAWSDAIAVALSGRDSAARVVAKTAAPSNEPPEPPPVIHTDDPQKDRWGGQPERNGRAIKASLSSVEDTVFYFSLVVESTDGSPLEPPVIFHLHNTYAKDVIPVTRITEGRQAVLRDLDAYGVSAVGVQVKDGSGRWTSLELDLAALPGLPKRFLDK